MLAPVTGNLADLVRQAAQSHPDKPALVFHGAVTTWSELDSLVDATAHGLRAPPGPAGC